MKIEDAYEEQCMLLWAKPESAISVHRFGYECVFVCDAHMLNEDDQLGTIFSSQY